MNDINDQIHKAVEQLKQERDELRVKLNLAKMDADDEWDLLEAKLEKLENKAKSIGRATRDASKEISTAAKLLGEEISRGFKSIAKKL